MNLSKNNKEKNTQKELNQNNLKNIIKFNLLEEDRELHKKMVSDIKQPIWKKYIY